MVSRTFYIVCGTSGSWMTEDRADWNVCVYDTQSAANCHVERAQRRADRIARAQRLWRDLRNEVATKHFNRWGDYTGRNPYDPWMQFNDGLRYFVEEIPRFTAVSRFVQE